MENCFDSDDGVGAVVVDFGFEVDYLRLLKAANNVTNPDTLFIAAATDKKIPIDGEEKRFVFGKLYLVYLLLFQIYIIFNSL